MSFNPRARVGRDNSRSASPLCHLLFQSTRPRGARQPDCQLFASDCSFNPRARVGRDMGADAKTSGMRGFNPRARVGRDV